MEKAKFTKVSENETRLDYKGNKFMLVEQDRGVYSSGRAIQLYLMKGFDKQHIKELGWTKSDGYFRPGDSDSKNSCIPHITTLEECKKASLKYIDLIS
jgi:hypothetical protein